MLELYGPSLGFFTGCATVAQPVYNGRGTILVAKPIRFGSASVARWLNHGYWLRVFFSGCGCFWFFFKKTLDFFFKVPNIILIYNIYNIIINYYIIIGFLI